MYLFLCSLPNESDWIQFSHILQRADTWPLHLHGAMNNKRRFAGASREGREGGVERWCFTNGGWNFSFICSFYLCFLTSQPLQDTKTRQSNNNLSFVLYLKLTSHNNLTFSYFLNLNAHFQLRTKQKCVCNLCVLYLKVIIGEMKIRRKTKSSDDCYILLDIVILNHVFRNTKIQA